MKAAALALLLVCALDNWPGNDIRLIAHRGGVVDQEHGENSLASLQEAIRQGYWMVEVDVRRSRDGELFVHHDDSFMRVYGVNKKAEDLNWEVVRSLHSRKDGSSPCSLAEYAAQCRGRIGVMIDSKLTGGQTDSYQRMEEILRANDLLKDALFIGSGEMKAYFKGKARIATDTDGLKRALDAGEDAPSLYFLFEHGNQLDDSAVKYAQALNVPVIPTVNDYHYLIKRRSSTPQSDIERLKGDGVKMFQIDSAYSAYCK